MVKKAFTLIEALYVIVILAFILIGGFQIISKLYLRNYIAKQTSAFEFQSQQVLDQMSEMLYYRVPLSVIGYNQQTGDFKYIGDITASDNYPILEWIGYANDAMVDANLSGFVDLYGSDKSTKSIKCMDFNYDFIQDVVDNKYNLPTDTDLNQSAAIIFAGTFDRGNEAALSDYNDSFGWHGNKHLYVYTFNKSTASDNNQFLTLNNFTHGNIYEKFYLVDGAYAVAKVSDLNESHWHCKDLKWSDLKSDDLLLFYNYRPWLGETFCADDNGNSDGNVTLLARYVKAFKVKKVNSHIELLIELLKSRGDINITVSKQKVTF